MTSPASRTDSAADTQADASPEAPLIQIARESAPVSILALMMFLVPAVGVPNELMLQDTLKSAIVAHGVLIAALVFFWQRRSGNDPLRWHGVVWLPIVLMLYALGSMVWSHTYLAGVEAIRWFLFSLLVWIGLNSITRRNFPLLLWGIHGGAMVASVWAALQFWFDWSLFPQGPQPGSTFYNRNFFAEFAVCAVPFSVLLLVSQRNIFRLTLVTIGLCISLTALMMTGTRSSLIALWVQLPVIAVVLIKHWRSFAWTDWTRGHRQLVVMIMVVAVGGLGQIQSSNSKIIAENFGETALQRAVLRTLSVVRSAEYTEGSFSIRSLMWKATARMAIANPLAGVGAGAWEVEIPLYQRVGTFRETDYYAHNEYLQLLSEYGGVVGGLFLAVLLAYVLMAADGMRKARTDTFGDAPVRAIALCSLCALLFVCNAGFPLHLAATGAQFALTLAILAGSDARIGLQGSFYESRRLLNSGGRNLALFVLMLCFALAVVVTWQAAMVEYKLTRTLLYLTAPKERSQATLFEMNDRKQELLRDVRDAIGIHAHYRKLTPVVADHLARQGDWANAVWIWETAAASRPNVAAFWFNLSTGYLRLERYAECEAALAHLVALQPNAPGSRALEVLLLSRTGQIARATQMLQNAFKEDVLDYDLVQAGFTVGYESRNWKLAIQSQELRIATWIQDAPDAYFKLGHIYTEPESFDTDRAQAAYSAGFRATPEEKKQSFRHQVPVQFRDKL
jgi:O-antigen ligase/tetratricopeptide (TPR) repeat protein